MQATLNILKTSQFEGILINEPKKSLNQKELDFINAFEEFESHIDNDKIKSEINDLKIKIEKLVAKRSNWTAVFIISLIGFVGLTLGGVIAGYTLLYIIGVVMLLPLAILSDAQAEDSHSSICKTSQTIEKLSNISENNKKDYYNSALLIMENRHLNPGVQSKITKSIKYLKSNKGSDMYLSLLKDKLNTLIDYYESKTIEDKFNLLDNNSSLLDRLS